MSGKKPRSRSSGTSGVAALEFALAGFVLIILGWGAADFGRLYYKAIIVAGAAESAARYGSQGPEFARDSETLRALLRADLGDDAEVEASFSCDCPDQPGTSVACESICPRYGPPRMYVRTGVESRFDTFGRYPGIPSATSLRAFSSMRVR